MPEKRFWEWDENDRVKETKTEFMSHLGLWICQIPIIYIWRKPIASLALSFLTASSMLYHKHMCMGEAGHVINQWLYLDYFAILASVPISFVPYSTIPRSEVWVETWPGILLIVLTCIMGLLGLFVFTGYWKNSRMFHSMWHLYICGPILLYAYIKEDIREVYSIDTFTLLDTTAIAAFFSLVLSQIGPILSSIPGKEHKNHGGEAHDESDGVDDEHGNRLNTLIF